MRNPLAQRIRNTLMHAGIHAAPLTDRMADTIEQQRVHYRDSPIVSGTGHSLRPATSSTSREPTSPPGSRPPTATSA